jgi:hypothetical protein
MMNGKHTPEPSTEAHRALSRRDVVASAVVAIAGLAVGASCASADSPMRLIVTSGTRTAHQEIDMKSIQFKNGPVTMSGNLHFPKGFDESRT